MFQSFTLAEKNWVKVHFQFENILKAQLKMCEYSKNNQQSYDDAFFIQLRITISILLVELSKLFVYFIFRSVKLHHVEETHMMWVAFGVGENCCSISAQNITKEIFVKPRFVDNWKQRLRLDSASAALCKWATCTRQTTIVD